ncbi:H-N-H-endonuclease [Escherichia phage Bf23]|uniref:H-N-H-endonuclease n=1 Tax=Escherichia phage Bf23 TaxID=2932881 RepID=A0AAF0NYG6_BPBF2|nr:H-N-H-endonuclease [Escherichia phage Bf23]
MSKQPTLERLKELLNYDPDTGIFTNKISRGRGGKAGAVAGYLRKDGYITIKIDKVDYLAHRLAFLYMTGSIPDLVDHINRIRSDNRWKNLRESTSQINNRNCTASSKSGYLGVHWNKQLQKWQVQIINCEGKNIYGGIFEYLDLENAVLKANTLRHELHGKDAVEETFYNNYYPTLEELNR